VVLIVQKYVIPSINQPKDTDKNGETMKDIYEFIQRRSDWKKIEKVVDKTMYNLSFKEDCVIC
jgi:hypothetical protein